MKTELFWYREKEKVHTVLMEHVCCVAAEGRWLDVLLFPLVFALFTRTHINGSVNGSVNIRIEDSVV